MSPNHKATQTHITGTLPPAESVHAMMQHYSQHYRNSRTSPPFQAQGLGVHQNCVTEKGTTYELQFGPLPPSASASSPFSMDKLSTLAEVAHSLSPRSQENAVSSAQAALVNPAHPGSTSPLFISPGSPRSTTSLPQQCLSPRLASCRESTLPNLFSFSVSSEKPTPGSPRHALSILGAISNANKPPPSSLSPNYPVPGSPTASPMYIPSMGLLPTSLSLSLSSPLAPSIGLGSPGRLSTSSTTFSLLQPLEVAATAPRESTSLSSTVSG